MTRRRRIVMATAIAAMLVCMGVLPFILMTLPNPQPLPSASPGARGNGVYVQDAGATFKLFPRAQLPSEWPKDALETDARACVYVRSRQYDELAAYGIFTFPEGRPLTVAREMVAGRMLRLTPSAPLDAGRYIVQVSRDDAFGGSDYFCLTVR